VEAFHPLLEGKEDGSLHVHSSYSVGFEILMAVVMRTFILGIKCRIVSLKATDVSEEHVSSILSVEE
jgi:hypothetical protein